MNALYQMENADVKMQCRSQAGISQTIILPVAAAVDPNAARSGGRGILFFRKLATVSKRADASGARGTWATGGGVSNTFYTRQEDERRDRKKKEEKKKVEVPTGEQQTPNLQRSL